MNTTEIKNVMEAALLCSAEPLSMPQLRKLFNDEFNAELIRPLLDELALDWNGRSVELAAVASGWRFQSKPQYAMFLNRLTPEKAPKYSRAVMETLAIIAYRQPVTRGDIEEIRGVSVGSQIIKTLEDRGWIDVIGHKEVPGRPALFATTKQFLDDLSLVSIKELPPIDEMGGEESVDFFGQQVTEVLEAGEQDSTSSVLHADEEGGSEAQSAPSQVPEALSEPDSESGDVEEQVSSLEGDSSDTANDRDGVGRSVSLGVLAGSEPGRENDSDEPAAEIAENRVDDEAPKILQEAEVAAASEELPGESQSDHPLAVEGGLVSDISDPMGMPEEAIAEVPGSKAEPDDDAGHAEVVTNGDFLVAATAEAAAALSEADDAADDAPAEPVNPRPSTPIPSSLKPSGPAVDDPNLEHVDWPDLPSLDGLDDAEQETSDQDPPGGESEPVESR